MNSLSTRAAARAIPVLILIACGLVAVQGSRLPAAETNTDSPEPQMPTYDDRRRLVRPEGYETWVFVGSSLGLSYSEGQAGMEMFHHTLMEPTAYQHFRETGRFRDGTMLALLLHGQGEGVLPSRRGRFASTIQGVEFAVKDAARVPEGWAYYNFGAGADLRESAQPMPAESCQGCHVEHAAYDNVFVQFYPLLVDAAPAGALAAALPGAMPRVARAEEGTPVALGGLDPVHRVAGRREPGKPEIVMDWKGHRYQFVSEPSRLAFSRDPARFAIQNTTCPVVPGAPIDSSLIAVHEARIYAFASRACVAQFEADPARYLVSE